MSPKEESTLITGLTVTGTIIVVGQYLIQFYDPALSDTQRLISTIFGVMTAGVLVVVNILLWKWNRKK